MKRKRPLALDYLVYVVVRLLVMILQALSVEQSYAFAGWLARLMYRVDKRHRVVAMENLQHAFGNKYSEAERDQIVRGVYLHFCRMIVEMLHIPRKMHLWTWRNRIELLGQEAAVEQLLQRGPVIMVTGHYGNWEMAGYLFGVFGFPTHAVARTLDNRYLDRFLRSFRERTGQKLIDKNSGYDEMLAVLKSGGALSFIADQDAGQRGLFVDFFGRPASTHKAIALLAIEYNAPILVGGARRIGPGFRYEVVTRDIIRPDDWNDQADAVRYVTQRFTTGLEELIRETPEQYLWLHRRWKHQPKARKPKGPHQPAQAMGQKVETP